RLGCLLVEERAGLAVHHGVERTTSGVGDDRPACRLCLYRGDAEVLLSREQEAAAAEVELLELLLANASQELDVAARSRGQRGAVASVPDDLQREAQALEGIDGEIDALVGNQARNHQVVASGSVLLGEEAGPHGQVDHGRVAPIVLLDARLD